MHLELPIVSFICAILSLAPLPWHWRARTIPTIAIALWLFVSNLCNGVNAVVWAGNADLVAAVWCDISTKINIGANVALPASIFCLCLHLERISSIRQASSDHAQKRRRQIFDLSICFGIPVVYMALHYVVQGHRFDIIEDFGCRPATYVSVASIFLIWVPPLFFSLGAFMLSGLAFRNFWNRRIMFARHLQTTSSLTPSRYFRLMAMSLVQMFWGVGVIALNMWFTMRGGLRPWISWEDVHFNFSRVAVFPTALIPPQALFITYLLWWTLPISTVVFFIFFSFGQDAMKEYRACFLWLRKVLFRWSPSREKKSILAATDSLPSYAQGGTSIDLSAFVKRDKRPSFSPSQTTLASPTSSFPDKYKWNPPPSPTPTSPTSSAHSGLFGQRSKVEDSQSMAETKSLSSICSTVKPV